MKINRFYGMTLAAALLLLTGCIDDEQTGQGGRVPVQLSVSQDAGSTFTRTTSDLHSAATGFVTNESMKVYMKDGATTTDGTYKVVVGGVNSVLGPISADDVLYYPTGSSGSVDLYAVYPGTVTQGSTHTVAYDQTGDDAYRASDLMFSAAKTVSLSDKGTLQSLNSFQHQMVRLKLNIVKDAGINSVTEVKMVNVKRQVTVSALSDAGITVSAATQATGETGAGANTDNILVFSGTNTSTAKQTYYVVFPKQAASGNDWDDANFITVTANAEPITYKLTKAFTAGSQYELTLNITASALGVTTDISDWIIEEDALELTNNGTTEIIGPPVPEIIDLGLSVKWANMNVGATSETDYGLYFAWGDVIGRSGDNTDGNAADGYSFTWTNTPYNYGRSSFDATKYNDTDGLTELEPCDDAAYMNWGGNWRMPTKAELEALAATRNTYDFGENNTTHWKWTWYDDYNSSGHAGYLISYRASLDNTDVTSTIFLPAAGYRRGKVVNDQGSNGDYWSSTLLSGLPDGAWHLDFSEYLARMDVGTRYGGYTVRPVYDPYTSISSATSSDVGKVICSYGHIHDTVSDVDCGGTASGIIAYVGDAGTADYSTGSGSYKGLALALYDYGGSLTTDGTPCQWYTTPGGTCITNGQSLDVSTAIGTTGDFGKGIDNTNRLANAECGDGHVHAAAQAAKNFDVARPTGASQWFLPTMYQWNLMVKAMCGGSADLTESTNDDYKADQFNVKITAAGGRGVDTYNYWSSVEWYTAGAWHMDFYGGSMINSSKNNGNYNYVVRPVFAF